MTSPWVTLCTTQDQAQKKFIFSCVFFFKTNCSTKRLLLHPEELSLHHSEVWLQFIGGWLKSAALIASPKLTVSLISCNTSWSLPSSCLGCWFYSPGNTCCYQGFAPERSPQDFFCHNIFILLHFILSIPHRPLSCLYLLPYFTCKVSYLTTAYPSGFPSPPRVWEMPIILSLSF